MLDIAFNELVFAAKEDLVSQKLRFGVYDSHRILQLIAKTECTAGLVIAASGPETAGDGLVHQPAVCQHVKRGIRCLTRTADNVFSQ